MAPQVHRKLKTFYPQSLTKQQIVANYVRKDAPVAAPTCYAPHSGAQRDCAACDARCRITLKVEVIAASEGAWRSMPHFNAAW